MIQLQWNLLGLIPAEWPDLSIDIETGAKLVLVDITGPATLNWSHVLRAFAEFPGVSRLMLAQPDMG